MEQNRGGTSMYDRPISHRKAPTIQEDVRRRLEIARVSVQIAQKNLDEAKKTLARVSEELRTQAWKTKGEEDEEEQ